MFRLKDEIVQIIYDSNSMGTIDPANPKSLPFANYFLLFRSLPDYPKTIAIYTFIS